MSLRLTYLLILLCACSLSAQTHNYPFQSEAPIANFTLNENDTLRYEGHYRFENAYQVIEDMLTDKRPLDFAESVFASIFFIRSHARLIIIIPMNMTRCL